MAIFGEKINFSDEILPHFVGQKKLTGEAVPQLNCKSEVISAKCKERIIF